MYRVSSITCTLSKVVSFENHSMLFNKILFIGLVHHHMFCVVKFGQHLSPDGVIQWVKVWGRGWIRESKNRALF
jgi:hypothetical protein